MGRQDWIFSDHLNIISIFSDPQYGSRRITVQL